MLTFSHVKTLSSNNVQFTRHFDSQWTEEAQRDAFIQEFSLWKSWGDAGAHSHYYFGKDGEYYRPTANGVRVLRHVHLVPEPGSSKVRQWDYAWSKQKRKRSDDVLIYTYGPRVGYLLIAMVLEPNGHKFARMRTEQDKRMMHNFVAVADQFLFDGQINI